MSTLNTKTEQNPSNDHHHELDPKEAKQKATEDKYRLFGTLQAIRQGKMPHNAQLHDLLTKLAQNQVILSREHLVSEDGKRLLNDFRQLIGTLQKVLDTKNKDELFQSMVYHLHLMESPVSKENINSAAKNNSDKESIKSEGRKASESIWRIGKLILINNEFRSLLGDTIDISQDIFTSITTKVGDSLKNTGDTLQESGQKQKPGKDLVDSALDQGIEHMSNSDSKENLRNSDLLSKDTSDPRHVGLLNTGDSVHPSTITKDVSTEQDPVVANNTASNSGSNSINTEEARESKEKLKNRVSHHFNDHKEHARQTVSSRIPKEKQDELLRRLQAVLSEIQKHPDYQNAIETLIDLVKVWSTRLSKITSDIEVHEQEETRELAEREFKTLLEAWAQGKSIDPLLHGLQDVMNDARDDPELREYYHSVMDYVKRLVREPGYASEESIDDGNRLMDRGRQVLRGNYDKHLRFLSDESRRYMNLMAEDEIAHELRDRFATIHKDLWMDSDGNPAFKPHLLNDIKTTMLPAFIDEIRYIPLPRIEYSDKQYDIAVENLVISGESLVPNIFDTKVESFNSFSLKSEVSKPSSQSLYIRMSEIQADIDDVVFFYKKKTGFPKIQDRGVASLAVDGKGITLVLRIHNSTDPNKTFKVDYCKCTVDNLKVKVNESRHNILYKTIAPLLMGTIRKQMAKSIETVVIEKINEADQRITRSIVKTNQRLQDKRYESLPESEKQNTQPQKLSPEQSRPGIWSTLVSIINNNIRSKVDNRNEKKREKKYRNSTSDQGSDVASDKKRPSVQFRESTASSYSSAHDSQEAQNERSPFEHKLSDKHNNPLERGPSEQHSSPLEQNRSSTQPLGKDHDESNTFGQEDRNTLNDHYTPPFQGIPESFHNNPNSTHNPLGSNNENPSLNKHIDSPPLSPKKVPSTDNNINSTLDTGNVH